MKRDTISSLAAVKEKRPAVPYLIDITQTYGKTIAVFAATEAEATAAAERFCSTNIVSLGDSNEFCFESICVNGGIARPDSLHCYELYDCTGKTVPLETVDRGQVSLDYAMKLISTYMKREFGEVENDTFRDLEKVSLAFTEFDADEQIPVPYSVYVTADLLHPSVKTFINDIEVSCRSYDSLEEMCSLELSYMNFDSLVQIVEEEAAVYCRTTTEGGVFHAPAEK